jgi:hypothetical protein
VTHFVPEVETPDTALLGLVAAWYLWRRKRALRPARFEVGLLTGRASMDACGSPASVGANGRDGPSIQIPHQMG